MKEKIKTLLLHTLRVTASLFVICTVVLACAVVIGSIGHILWKALLYGFNLI